jgi:hypothetical protein
VADKNNIFFLPLHFKFGWMDSDRLDHKKSRYMGGFSLTIWLEMTKKSFLHHREWRTSSETGSTQVVTQQLRFPINPPQFEFANVQDAQAREQREISTFLCGSMGRVALVLRSTKHEARSMKLQEAKNLIDEPLHQLTDRTMLLNTPQRAYKACWISDWDELGRVSLGLGGKGKFRRTS